jgi:hypothetical protein
MKPWTLLSFVLLAGLAGAATPPVTEGPTIELPPMIVAESAKLPPWLYVAAGGTEYLSRCSVATTREFVQSQLEAQRLLRILAPDKFFARMDASVVSVLVPLDQKRASDDAVREEVIRLDREARRREVEKDREKRAIPTESLRVFFAPNMRLDDRDMSAVFTYVDERSFEGDQLISADDYVQHLFLRRTPMLPPWMIEGFVSVYRESQIRQRPIAVPRITWLSPDETAALRRDRETPRTLLTGEELFSPTALSAPENRHPERSDIWRAQVALFFRWALDPAHVPANDALWRFVAIAAERLVTEADFAACFGFGFSDLRDRLSDYLPTAVGSIMRIDPGKLPSLPRVEIKEATPAQIARLRGEWERLQIPFVRTKYPQFLPRYVRQARLTLQKAYDSGDRDPRLVAALGFLELDAGNVPLGQQLLEAAAAAAIVRPRVHYEVAHLRWLDLTRDLPANQSLGLEKMEAVLAPLRVAMAQSPLLPEAVALMTETWLRCASPPTEKEFAALGEATSQFHRMPSLGFRMALLYAQHGHYAKAKAGLEAARPFVVDPALLRHFEQLQAGIARQ